MAILKTKDLKKIYGSGENEVHALDGVSISVEDGEFVAIVGTSGSGKSTLLNMLGELDRPTSGSVIVRGKELMKMGNEQLTIFRRRNVGFVFQNYNLLPILNVYENIVYPIEIDGSKADKEFLRRIIHSLGLEHKLKNMPNNLSGGQQRVAIARALATKAAIILADEPTGNLDSKTSMDVILLMQSVSREFNQTILMITAVFSLGINYKENMDLMEIRSSSTNADVMLAMPTAEQEKEIRSLDYVNTIGIQYRIGSVTGKNEADRDLVISMQYYDNTEWEKHYKEAISNINGTYPEGENEILLSEDALSQLGIENPKPDMEIPLSYVSKDGEQNDTFTLSGWFSSYTGTGMAFLSESYCLEHGYTLQNNGVLSMSLDRPKENFYDIQDDISLNENQTFQGSISLSSSSGSLYAMVILLVFFIIGSGYLLIYNVLYISISRDTRFCGLIKTLGTTERQIKTLVKRQTLTFACIGIPIGIILAGILSFGIVPFLLENAFNSGKSIMDAEIIVHTAESFM